MKPFRSAFVTTSLSLLAVSATLGSSDARSQQAQSRDVLEEVIVTARFREESAQDIGASIAALGGDELVKSGIVDFEDIARRIAGVELLDGGANRNEITIRGVSNSVTARVSEVGVQALVGVYIDDVSISVNGAGNGRDFNLFDFNRVEVLRGPQPTLFGEGSVGGVVRYFSQDPSLDGDKPVDGTFSSDISSTKEGDINYRIEGAAGFTLIPNELGLRLVASYRENGGFIDNPAINLEDINDLESVSGRAVLLYEPNDELSVRLSALVARDETGEFNEINPVGLNGSVNDDQLVVTPLNTFDGTQHDDYELFSGKLSWDTGPMIVESITGYYQREINAEIFDSALTFSLPPAFNALGLTAFGNIANFDPLSIRTVDTESESFSQEFRFISGFDGPLNFTAGLFYQKVDYTIESTVFGPGYLDILSPSMMTATDNMSTVDSEQYSGFIELTYELSDRVRIIGGARYVNETVTDELLRSNVLDLSPTGIIINPGPPPALLFNVPNDLESLAAAGLPTEFEFELDEVLPRLGLEFDLGDSMLIYVNVAKGIRNGGLNGVLSSRFAGVPGEPAFDDALRYEADEATTSEIGLKSDWLDGALILNVAAYHTDYKDPQVSVGTPVRAVQNAPDQRIIGIELETSYTLNNNISMYFAGSYTDAEYQSGGSALEVRDENGMVLLGFEDIMDGNSAPNVPDFSFSAGIDLTYPSGWNELDFVGRLDFSYTGERFTTPQNFAASELGALEILNLRAGLENDRFSIVGYVTNLTNDLEITSLLASPSATSFINGELQTIGATSNAYVNQPRTLGLSVSLKF